MASEQEARPEVEDACRLAAAAQAASLDSGRRTALLEAIAGALDARREQILGVCASETALTVDELAPEFARTTGTLRMFAGVVREGSWRRAAIDTPGPAAIGPNHDVRRLLVPLRPVAVFGSSNFPLAYGVCGGDTASALAAGCPVVVKEHPAHPRTGRLIAQIAGRAIAAAGCDAGWLGYVHNEDPKDLAVARALVSHRQIAAVGFTGSLGGGLAIERVARERQVPIPVFAEMGSMNAIVVLRHALRARPERIVDELAQSLLARHGQQCTAPGMIIVAGHDHARWVFQAMAERIKKAPARRMLAPWIAETYRHRVREVLDTGAIEACESQAAQEGGDPRLASAVLMYAQSVRLEDQPTVWEEIFGPAAIVAGADSNACGYLFTDGALTATLIADPEDFKDSDLDLVDDAYLGPGREVQEWLQRRAGRIIFNGVPTGVRVAAGMVHGGPFPATNRPESTAVGPFAIERWCRPVCFQNCPDELLPPELQAANPLGIRRLVNGKWE